MSCALSWNASRENEAAAVFFHSVWTSRAKEFPQRRLHPDSLWVWAAAEAPSNWDVSVEQSAGLLPVRPLVSYSLWSFPYSRVHSLVVGSLTPRWTGSST